MKTKLQISIERSGETTDNICRLIANHNEGLNLFTIQQISSVIRERKNAMPSLLRDLKVEFIESEGKINVYENGKDLTYTIQENEYFTLDMVDENDKEKQIAGQDALFLNPVHERNKK